MYKCWFEKSCMTEDDCYIQLPGTLRMMQPSILQGNAVIAFVDTEWLSLFASKSIGTPVPEKYLTKQSDWKIRYYSGARFDFPQIACLVRDSIHFVEGRNRSLVAHEVGINTIPVMIPRKNLEEIFEHISDNDSFELFDFTDVKYKFPNVSIYRQCSGKLIEV